MNLGSMLLITVMFDYHFRYVKVDNKLGGPLGDAIMATVLTQTLAHVIVFIAMAITGSACAALKWAIFDNSAGEFFALWNLQWAAVNVIGLAVSLCMICEYGQFVFFTVSFFIAASPVALCGGYNVFRLIQKTTVNTVPPVMPDGAGSPSSGEK